MLTTMVLLVAYPVCTAVETAPGVLADVRCVEAQEYRGRRFCGYVEGQPPGGLFVDYPRRLRFVLLTDHCMPEDQDALGWCVAPRITGLADRKTVRLGDNGEATATFLVKVLDQPWTDDFERLDLFATSPCTFSFAP